MNRAKNYYLILVILISTISSCSNGQSNKNKLSAEDFNSKINTTTNAIILDVRTPEEFAKGHLLNAININWNDANSEAELKKLDVSKTYFVYCLSGGRSSDAAEFLRVNGFKDVYELNGGILKWRAAKFAETVSSTSAVNSAEMSLNNYNKLLINDKVVVIDFYADWCGPCKKMAPYLKELQQNMGDKVEIIKIDADKNPGLCKQLNVEALPTIFVYKSNKKTFEHIGYLSKEDLLKQL